MKTPHRLLLFTLLLVGMTSCRYAGRAFGPQDEGGMYLIIAVKADGAQLDQAVAQTIDVMQNRCDQLNIYCKVERVGGDKPNQIKLRISSPKNPERVKGVILSQGLELRAVVSPPSPAPVQTYPTREEAVAAAGADKEVLPYLERQEGAQKQAERFVILQRAPIVSGQDISDADAVALRENDYVVNFTLSPAAAQRFGQWTGANIGFYLAVVLNRQVRSVAYIKSQIFDQGQISGRFTKEQAEDAALVLKSGNLPAPIEALEEGTYKP